MRFFTPSRLLSPPSPPRLFAGYDTLTRVFQLRSATKVSLSNFHAAWNEVVDRALPKTVLWRDIFPYSTGTVFQHWPHYLRLWITNVQPNVRRRVAQPRWQLDVGGHKKVMTAMKDNCDGVGRSAIFMTSTVRGCCNELWTCIVCLKSLFPSYLSPPSLNRWPYR